MMLQHLPHSTARDAHLPHTFAVLQHPQQLALDGGQHRCLHARQPLFWLAVSSRRRQQRQHLAIVAEDGNSLGRLAAVNTRRQQLQATDACKRECRCAACMRRLLMTDAAATYTHCCCMQHTFEALAQVRLHLLRVARLAQDEQQVVTGEEVEAREREALGLQVHL